jgi:hypothetical protein
MNDEHPIAAPASDKDITPAVPVMDADAELTPKKAAQLANALPKAEQLEHFEEDLEEHDPGNQPA